MRKNEMDDMIKNVHLLRSVHASDALRQSIITSSKDLPKTQNSRYLPLAVVQVGVIALSVLLFVVLGSGVVAADQLTHKGQPLYCVRQTIEQLPVLLVHKKVTPTPTGKPTPTIALQPSATPTPEKSNNSGNHKSTSFGDVIHKAVKAAFDFQGNRQQLKQNVNYKSVGTLKHTVNK